MDNVKYHISKYTSKELKKLQLEAIRNLCYRPDRNPAELIFSQLKRDFRARRLSNLMADESFDPKKLL